MIKTAIFGGSFDPVHLGHLFLLHNAVQQTDYNRFIVIPAKLSNFKRDSKPVASDEDRFNMLQLALQDYHELYPEDSKEISVSDMELKRGGVSYTYETVIQIKKQYGLEERLGLLMGEDPVSSLTKWYRYDCLKEEVEFVICPRENAGNIKGIPSDIKYRLLSVDKVLEENATDIRSSIETCSSYLSRRVLAYARERKLYL